MNVCTLDGQLLKNLVNVRVATGDRAILKTVRHWKTGKGDFTAFYFRSEVCRKKEVPVYAVIGVPRGEGPFPGVLHFHGGGQTADPELVDILVGYGYAAISFDWTGPSQNRRHVTRWNGCAPRYSGMAPDESLLVRALTAGRQALSILAEHPRVAADRLGEFGVSWGGFQTWLLNAMDDRLGAAIPIYGCGITRSQVLAYFRGELKPPRRFDPDAWLELYNPIHYVREQRGPTLFLNGTNDFFGWMDTYRQLAEELDGRHRCAFAAQLNHSIGSLNPTLLAWYDCHLRGGVFPAGPVVSGDWTRCGLELHSAAQPGILATTFFVAPENGIGPDLYWMPVKSKRCKSGFQATVPSSLLGTRHAMVYAHQEFANGVALSSLPIRLAGPPACVQARKCQMLPVTSEVWHGPAPVNPLNPFIPLQTRKPHLAWKTGVNGNFSFNTRVVALPGYRLSSGAIFRSCLQGPVADPVNVAVLQYAGSPRERRFQGDFCRAELEKGIPTTALKDSHGQGLRTGVQLSHLYIGGKNVRPGVVKLTKASFCRIKHNIQKTS